MRNYGDWVRKEDYWWNSKTGDLLYPDGTMNHDNVIREGVLQTHNTELFKHSEKKSEEDTI